MRLANYIDKGEVLLMSELIHDAHEQSQGGKIEVIMYVTWLGVFLIAIFIGAGTWKSIIYIASLILSGYHIIMEGFLDTFQQSIKKKKFMPNIQILMTLAAVGAVII